jgi:hypothetical protein
MSIQDIVLASLVQFVISFELVIDRLDSIACKNGPHISKIKRNIAVKVLSLIIAMLKKLDPPSITSYSMFEIVT